MTGFNHGLTGAVIALAVKQPFLALSLAFVSHFVCDVIPHFGFSKSTPNYGQKVKLYSLTDLVLILILGLFIIFLHLPWVVLVAYVLAGSPDFVWFYRYYIKQEQTKSHSSKLNKFNQFHSNIQTSETVWPGLFIEFCYAIVMLIIFTKLS